MEVNGNLERKNQESELLSKYYIETSSLRGKIKTGRERIKNITDRLTWETGNPKEELKREKRRMENRLRRLEKLEKELIPNLNRKVEYVL